MTRPTHSEMVRTLKKDGDEIVLGLNGDRADLWHMATGVAGETTELLDAVFVVDAINRENLVEELGDLEFFLEGIRQITGIERNPNATADGMPLETGWLAHYAVQAAILGGHVLDVVKRHAVYAKALDLAELEANMSTLDSMMDAVRRMQGVTREETLEANIDKLGVRYEQFKYSDEQAQNRRDKA